MHGQVNEENKEKKKNKITEGKGRDRRGGGEVVGKKKQKRTGVI